MIASCDDQITHLSLVDVCKDQQTAQRKIERDFQVQAAQTLDQNSAGNCVRHNMVVPAATDLMKTQTASSFLSLTSSTVLSI